MRKEDIRNAFAALEMHKPLKLRPPSKGPEVSRDQSKTKDAEVSPDFLGSGDTHSPSDAGRSVDEKGSTDTPKPKFQNTSTDRKDPRDESRSKDSNSSQDHTESVDQNVPEFIERSRGGPRRATEQDQSVTRTLSLKGTLANGYTRLPNEVLMAMVEGDLSRSEMKILLLVARLTISFNRELAPISKSVLERMTGIQGRKALTAVADLEAKGLIRKQKGDAMQPNALGLCAKVTLGTKASLDSSGPDPQDPKRSQGWDPNGPHFKDKNQNKEKISLSEFSAELRKYFSELPDAKRESERAALGRLGHQFSAEQIERAFSHLGKLEIPPHSPIAFLEKAIGDVLPKAEAAQRMVARRLEYDAQAAAARQAELDREAAEALEFERREKAFLDAFPSDSERKAAFDRFAPKNLWYKPGSRPHQMQIINAWFQSQTGGHANAEAKANS